MRSIDDGHPDSDADAPVVLDEYLRVARARLDRVDPDDAHAAVEAGAVLVDIRPAAQRAREGEIPGSLVIDRNVLEWRLAPGSAHRVPEVAEPGTLVVLFCSEGYASSLAAAVLVDLGVDATDLIGGYIAWQAAGLPVQPAGKGDDRTRPVGVETD